MPCTQSPGEAVCLSVTQRQLDVFHKTPQSDLKALCCDPVDLKHALCCVSCSAGVTGGKPIREHIYICGAALLFLLPYYAQTKFHFTLVLFTDFHLLVDIYGSESYCIFVQANCFSKLTN